MTFGDLYRQFNVQKLSILSLFHVCMIQNPQTWCQIEAFSLKNKLVLQKVYSLFCSKVTIIFVVKYATIVSHPHTILKYVQNEGLPFQYFIFFY